MSEVVLDKIQKSYGTTMVVPDLSLEIKQGEFLSLLGPSGCGKTTILRMVAGLEQPTGGKIRIGKRAVYDKSSGVELPPEKRNLGMVFQSYAIWPHLTVLENVIFPLRYRKVPKSEWQGRARKALASVRLEALAERKPHQLSGGQQQRVALARALVATPEVLLLDEPLSNLDANLREEMCDELAALRKEFPITMLYVTHDRMEAFRLSDRIALLNKGLLEQIDTPDGISKNPKSEFVKKFLKV